MAPIEVVPVPCLRDNYSYLVYRQASDGSCLIVNACEAEPIRAEVVRRGLRPKAILTTHHHLDHVGGNVELSRDYSIPVYGHESEWKRIPAMTVGLSDRETWSIGPFQIRALHVPGHTLGALAYVLDECCFTGDTLFCGGCGRLFEGTAEQLHHSLNHVLARLDPRTQLYTGHEYTLSNMVFAAEVFSRSSVIARLRETEQARRAGRYCAGAPLREELESNPFLNCHDPELQKKVLGDEWPSIGKGDPLEVQQQVFARLRALKDRA